MASEELLNETSVEEEIKEYVTFTDITGSGREIELAVMDEFEFDKKLYVVGALIEDDRVNDENLFIYRLLLKGEDDYSVEKITDIKEYETVAKAYVEM